MPEAPELEVVKGFLTDRAVGASVESARVLRPSVLRSIAGSFEDDIAGRALEDVRRTGKFLTLAMSGDRLLVVNPMLTGGFPVVGPVRPRLQADVLCPGAVHRAGASLYR